MKGRQILLVRSLGDGATGTRFRAMERYGSHRRSVFVHLARSEAERAALEDLSRSWSGDGGPLLAAMRPSWRQAGQQALVMDHPGGASLRNLLATHRRLPPAIALRIAAEVARGLANFWRDTPPDSGSEQAIDLDGAYLRGDGRLALVCRICEREQLSELVGRLLGGSTEQPDEIFDELAQSGELDLKDTLASLPADGEEAGRALGTLARTFPEPELGAWAQAHVDAAQRCLPPAAVDPAFGRVLGEEDLPLVTPAVTSAEETPSSPPPAEPQPDPIQQPTVPTPAPPQPRPDAGMPDIRPSMDAPAAQLRRQRTAAGVGMAVFFTIVGIAAIASGQTCGTGAEAPPETTDLEAAEAAPPAPADEPSPPPEGPETPEEQISTEELDDPDVAMAEEPETTPELTPPDPDADQPPAAAEPAPAPEPAPAREPEPTPEPEAKTRTQATAKTRTAKTSEPKAPTPSTRAAKPTQAATQPSEDADDDHGSRTCCKNLQPTAGCMHPPNA